MSIYFDIKDFEYYVMLAKALKESLKEQKEKNICDKWIELLRNSKFCDDYLNIIRNHVLKLLLVSLKSNILVGPFEKSPKFKNTINIEFLKTIAFKYTERDIIKMIITKNYVPELLLKSNSPITQLCYSIYQEIDNFGGHYYTTLSHDPITSFKDLDDKILPIGIQYIIPKLCKNPE